VSTKEEGMDKHELLKNLINQRIEISAKLSIVRQLIQLGKIVDENYLNRLIERYNYLDKMIKELEKLKRAS
jgi:hypothetical protein